MALDEPRDDILLKESHDNWDDFTTLCACHNCRKITLLCDMIFIQVHDYIICPDCKSKNWRFKQ